LHAAPPAGAACRSVAGGGARSGQVPLLAGDRFRTPVGLLCGSGTRAEP